jgi:hypothetical protein
MLNRDAQWLFHWGDGWAMGADGHIYRRGTPLLIVGRYNYDGARPWLDPEWWTTGVTLPDTQVALLR